MNKSISNINFSSGLLFRSIALFIWVLSGHCAIGADIYPARPIRIMIGFAPGGSADTVARAMAPKMSELLKQSVVIENHPGAGLASR
jgi:tripartite-type tricarboxylate transporter receptor subunit TctC